MNMELNETWIAGKYTVNSYKVEINTALPYLSIDRGGIDFFSQGEEASENIALIHNNWLKNGCTIEDSIQWFINTYLIF